MYNPIVHKATQGSVTKEEFIEALSRLNNYGDDFITMIRIIRTQLLAGLKDAKKAAEAIRDGYDPAELWDQYRPNIIGNDATYDEFLAAFNECVARLAYGTAIRVLENAGGFTHREASKVIDLITKDVEVDDLLVRYYNPSKGGRPVRFR